MRIELVPRLHRVLRRLAVLHDGVALAVALVSNVGDWVDPRLRRAAIHGGRALRALVVTDGGTRAEVLPGAAVAAAILRDDDELELALVVLV